MRERKWQMENASHQSKKYLLNTYYVSDTILILAKATFSIK